VQCIANAGGGKYYDAKNAAELKVAASEVKEKIAAAQAPPPASPTTTPTPYVKKEESLYGDPIRGGDAYADAVPIPSDKLFHLDHTQPKGKQDFFSLAVRGGQSLIVTMTSGLSSSVGAVISDAQHQQLASGDVDAGRRQKQIRRDVADHQDGTYYILIGSPYYPQDSDSIFRVDLVNNYDANSDRDAGSEESRALEVAPDVYMHNYMNGDTDQIDIFKFKADGGTAYAFKARPGDPKATLQLQATNSDGDALGQAQSPNPGAAAKLEDLKVAKSGSVYVKVSYDQYGSKGPYSFALGNGDIDSPPPPPVQ
jgi:hypothetical protein